MEWKVRTPTLEGGGKPGMAAEGEADGAMARELTFAAMTADGALPGRPPVGGRPDETPPPPAGLPSGESFRHQVKGQEAHRPAGALARERRSRIGGHD